MKQRQIAPDRRQDAYARIPIAEAGMDVYATDDGAAHGLLVRGRELSVTIPWRGGLIPPKHEGMGGGGHHCGAMLLGRFDDKPSGLAQHRAHFGH